MAYVGGNPGSNAAKPTVTEDRNGSRPPSANSLIPRTFLDVLECHWMVGRVGIEPTTN